MTFRSRPLLVFLGQSIIAGLALAFLALYIFPGLAPRTSTENSGQRNSTSANLEPEGQRSYHTAVQASAPAVVNIYASKVRKTLPNPLFQDPLFRRFFGDQGLDQRATNLGSGVIMSTNGTLITNAHIVKDADEIGVTLADGRQSLAEVIGIDSETDLAVLKIDLAELPVVPIGNSDRLQVGDIVLAIGNPYDLSQTVTQGIVSAVGRSRLGISTFENFIQTDADINPGNSGGALINTSGELVGINTAIYSMNGGGSQGIGFSIPINVVTGIMQSLIRHGHVIRGWLGIEAQAVPPDVRNRQGARLSGILVAGVMQNSPAADANIIPGDIIIEINGIPIDDPYRAIQMIAEIPPGDTIEILLLRGWRESRVQAIVGQRPALERG
ncbi:MAG TPA: trypsin-like peptidase domain-containing protein [Gammaproteobacteria bacterium]|nr:trypsin-like peptidase domain-containing protein [Gammaproteobacteria bacterium]